MSTQASKQVSFRNEYSIFEGIESDAGEITGILSDIGVDGLPTPVYKGAVRIQGDDIFKHGRGTMLMYNGNPYLTGLFENDEPKEKEKFVFTLIDGTEITGPISGISEHFFHDRIEAHDFVSHGVSGKYDRILDIFIDLEEPELFYVPYGLCTEVKDGNIIYEGMYNYGYRHGKGELYLNAITYVDGKFNYDNLTYAKLFVNDNKVFDGVPTFETTLKFGEFDFLSKLSKKNKITETNTDEPKGKKSKKSKK